MPGCTGGAGAGCGVRGELAGTAPRFTAGSQALQYSCPHGQGKCEHLPLGAAPSWALLAEESTRERLRDGGDRGRRSGRNSALSTQAPFQQPSASEPLGIPVQQRGSELQLLVLRGPL